MIENKRRTHRGKSNKWSTESRAKLSAAGQSLNLKKGAPAAQKSPVAGPFETNQNALVWYLVAPDGERITCRNLNLWLRKNAARLDGSPEQARAGIMAIKQSMTGKRKHPVNSWKGWRLVGWEEIK